MGSNGAPATAGLVVIGAGPGGYAAAFLAADLGMDVALVDPAPNPGGARQRRKTHKGMARFFFNWFSSVLDRRGRGLGYRPPRRVAKDTERLFRDLETELETTP